MATSMGMGITGNASLGGGSALPHERGKQKKQGMKVSSINYSSIGIISNLRILSGRDVKFIITSKNNSTGLGKTTLGTFMANKLDQHGWHPRDKGFVGDLWAFKNAHNSEESLSALLLDELEHCADRRSPMSKTNKELRQVLAKFRVRQMFTIFTAPTIDLIDRDILSSFDFWINVTRQGSATVNYLYTSDFDSDGLKKWRLKNPYHGGYEIISFPSPMANDSIMYDMAYMDKKKEKILSDDEDDHGDEEVIKRKEHQKIVRAEQKEMRDELIKLWTEAKGDVSTNRDIAEALSEWDYGPLEGEEISHTRIAQIRSQSDNIESKVGRPEKEDDD